MAATIVASVASIMHNPVIALALLAVGAAQMPPFTYTPVNETLGVDSSLILQLGSGAAQATFAIEPAWNSTLVNGLTPEPAVSLQGGVFILTAPYANFGVNRIAVLCCDPGAYGPGNGSASSAGDVSTPGDSDVILNRILDAALPYMSGEYGILFYSRYSTRCTIASANSSFNEHTTNIFTATYAADSLDIEARLRGGPLQGSIGQAGGLSTSASSASSAASTTATAASGSSHGSSSGVPTTNIAMVILYVITGLVTAGFIAVIVAATLRVRRHPQWYLTRDDWSGTGGRAKVLGRAILDSIPIIKFGEPRTVPDAEMAGVKTVTEPDEQAHKIATLDVDDGARPDASKSAGVGGQHVTGDVQESGEQIPTCSICVEEFRRGDDVRVLPRCRHQFHPQCLDPWLLNVASTCPLCRLDLQSPSNSSPSDPPVTNDPIPTDTPITLAQATNEHPLSHSVPVLAPSHDSPSSLPYPLCQPQYHSVTDNTPWLIPTNTPGLYQRIDAATLDELERNHTRRARTSTDTSLPPHSRRRRLSRLLFSRAHLRDQASEEDRVLALRTLRNAINARDLASLGHAPAAAPVLRSALAEDDAVDQQQRR